MGRTLARMGETPRGLLPRRGGGSARYAAMAWSSDGLAAGLAAAAERARVLLRARSYAALVSRETFTTGPGEVR